MALNFHLLRVALTAFEIWWNPYFSSACTHGIPSHRPPPPSRLVHGPPPRPLPTPSLRPASSAQNTPPGRSTAVLAFPQVSGLAFLGEVSCLCKILHVNQSDSGHEVAFTLFDSSWKWPTARTSSDQGFTKWWDIWGKVCWFSLDYLSPPLLQTEAASVATQAQAIWRSLVFNS